MVTSFYSGIYAVVFIFLSINVIKSRRINKVIIGGDGNVDLLRRIRAQNNFLEYSIFFMILFGLAEKNGLNYILLNILALVFLAGRVMHAYSLLVHEKILIEDKIRNPVWRIRGMMCSINCILFLAIFDICFPIYELIK